MKRRLRVYLHLAGIAWRAGRGMTLAVAALTAAATVSAALTALGLERTVSEVAAGRRTAALVALAATVLGVGLVHVADHLRANLQHDLTTRMHLDIENGLIVAIAGVDGLQHLERPDYLDKVENLRVHAFDLASSLWGPVQTLAALGRLGIAVWLLVAVHPALGLLPVLGVPSLMLRNRAATIAQRSDRRAAPAQRLEDHLMQLCTQPKPAKEVRISQVGGRLDEIARSRWDAATAVIIRARLIGGGLDILGEIVFVAAYVGAVGLAAALVLAGERPAAVIVLVVVLATQIRDHLDKAINGYADTSGLSPIVEDFIWFQQYAADQRRPAGAPPLPARLGQGIAVEGVSFRYPGTDRDVLRDVDLRLPAGAVVAVVGDNGAGKSTFVKLLMGFYRPTAGRITVDGVPLDEVGTEDWRARVSGAFQDFARFEVPVRQAVGIGDLPHADDEDAVRRAVREAGAESLVDRLPRGLDTPLGVTFDGVELSQGQWQRLALARAGMRAEPLLLVLDEPTAAIDAQTEQELFERYARQARSVAASCGGITLLVSHRYSTVRDADLICVFAGGTLVEAGTHDELMLTGGEYATVYGRQAHAYR